MGSIDLKNINNSELIKLSIQEFNNKMEQKLVDELAVVHVIGAFSAGKSRLIRELLRQYKTIIPLLPISSQERQSALPLEITYGNSAQLQLIHNENKTVLSAFPSRKEQKDLDIKTHYLRLEVPEDKLLLGNIELVSAEEGIKRLLIKDMPGWNSGDSFIAKDPLEHGLVSSNNISLVYVVRANGVDGKDDLNRLEAIFNAVLDGDAFFFNGFNLVVVITRCEENESNAINTRLEERLNSLAKKTDIEDEFTLTILCVDFGKEQEARDHSLFINKFWQAISKPIEEDKQDTINPDWANKIQHWKDDWLIKDKFIQTLNLLKLSQQTIINFRKENQFIAYMNNTRLLGLSKEERRVRVYKAWVKQVGNWKPSKNIIEKLHLDDDHPLAMWWNHYWLGKIYECSQVVDLLVLKMEKLIKILPSETSDLQQYFYKSMKKSYLQAVNSLDNSFYLVGKSLEDIKQSNDEAKKIATMLYLSNIDEKYNSCQH